MSWDGVPRSWVACIGEAGREQSLAGLPERRRVTASRESGRSLWVHGSSGKELPDVALLDSLGVAFEGRLFEREELARRLEIATGVPDVELVAHAYRRWGRELPSRLRGQYALVLWDDRRQELLAVRDRMGFYPLYYAETAAEWIFSTSPSLVALHPRVEKGLHRAALAEMLCFRLLDLHETYYERIHRLPPAWALSWNEQGRELARYWSARFGDWLDRKRDDIPGRFDEAFGRAVSRAMAAGDPAIFLSGGLDSVCIAIEIARRTGEAGEAPPLALSLGFPDEVDEISTQEGVARELGLPQVLLRFWEAAGGERTLIRTAELSADYPAPLLNLWRRAYLTLGSAGVSRGCRSIVTGHGGDEWIDSGIDLATDLIRTFDLPELYRLWRMAKLSYPVAFRQRLRNIFWRWGLRPLLVEAASKVAPRASESAILARRRTFIDRSTPEFLAPDPALRAELDRRAEAMLPGPRSGSPYRQGTPAYLESPSVVFFQEDNFEASRRIGAPLLMPFLDEDLVELVCRIRPQDFYTGGRSKGLLRSRVVAALPRLGFDRQKKLPATSFMRRIVREQTMATWQELGGTPALARMGIVDEGKLKEKLDLLVQDKLPRAYNLSVFTFGVESWTRGHS
jgi:asparagine synthase (glutamine-hydrolysing)